MNPYVHLRVCVALLLQLLMLVLFVLPVRAELGNVTYTHVISRDAIQQSDIEKLSPEELQIVLEAMALGWNEAETEVCLQSRKRTVARAFGYEFASQYGNTNVRLHNQTFLRHYRIIMGLPPDAELPADTILRYQESGRRREAEVRRKMRPTLTETEQRGFEALAVGWNNPHEGKIAKESRRRDAVRAFGPDWVEMFEESDFYMQRNYLKERYLQKINIGPNETEYHAELRYLESYALNRDTDVAEDIEQRFIDSWRERRQRERATPAVAPASHPQATAEKEKRATTTRAKRIGLYLFYGMIGVIIGGYGLYRFARLSHSWPVHYWASLFTVLLLLIAAGKGNWNGYGWPWWTQYELADSFFVFLRLVVTAQCAWQVILAMRAKAHPLLILVSAALCILYQPFIIVEMAWENACWTYVLSAVFIGVYPSLMSITRRVKRVSVLDENAHSSGEQPVPCASSGKAVLTGSESIRQEDSAPPPDIIATTKQAAEDIVHETALPEMSGEEPATSEEVQSTPEQKDAKPRSFLWTWAYFVSLYSLIGAIVGMSGYQPGFGVLWMLLFYACAWGLKRWLESSATLWRIGLYCLGVFWFFLIVICGGASLVLG